MTEVLKYRTVSDSVYDWLKDSIIHGEFKPGEHLAQERITEMLGVSRTPVRDAMKRLEAEGLVVVRPHCGAVVFDITGEQLTELYEIRLLLEQYCAERTCKVITPEQIKEIEKHNVNMRECRNNVRRLIEEDGLFHRKMCAISGCTGTIEVLETLWTRCDAFKSIYYSIEDKVVDTLKQHEAIIDAFIKHDEKKVKKAISDHLMDVLKTNLVRIRSDQASEK